MNEESQSSPLWLRLSGLGAGLLWFLLIGVLEVFGRTGVQASVLAVGGLMIFWWVTEALPMAVVAPVPLILFPFTGVM